MNNHRTSNKQHTLQTLRTLVTQKGLGAPRVTTDSNKERAWYPAFIVRE
jgi:hypothetical protein